MEKVVVSTHKFARNVEKRIIQTKTRKVTSVGRNGVTDVTVKEQKIINALCLFQRKMRRD